MDMILSHDDAATLAAARAVLYDLEVGATKSAMHVLGDTTAGVNAYDLARVAASAKHAKDALQDALISFKVYGESEEAGAVL